MALVRVATVVRRRWSAIMMRCDPGPAVTPWCGWVRGSLTVRHDPGDAKWPLATDRVTRTDHEDLLSQRPPVHLRLPLTNRLTVMTAVTGSALDMPSLPLLVALCHDRWPLLSLRPPPARDFLCAYEPARCDPLLMLWFPPLPAILAASLLTPKRCGGPVLL